VSLFNDPQLIFQDLVEGSKSISDLFSHLKQNNTFILLTLKLVNDPDFV
jgi:hypothetical protein